MTKFFTLGLVLITLLSFSACTSATNDIKVKSASSSKINMDGYKTYELLASINVLLDENENFKDSGFSVNEYIESKVHKQLLNKDKIYSKTEPDFFVSYALGINMDAMKEKVNEEGKKTLENIPEAALAVVMIDAHTGKIIWIGSAEAKVQVDSTDEQTKERIDYALEEMFKSL